MKRLFVLVAIPLGACMVLGACAAAGAAAALSRCIIFVHKRSRRSEAGCQGEGHGSLWFGPRLPVCV